MKTNSSSERHSLFERIINYSSIAIAALLAASCVSVNHLREAQETFNQAAAAENALRLDSKPADAVATSGSVRSGYASALLSLEKLEPDDQQKLRADGLWGTTLTLKALAQWRLGLYDKALETARDAQKNAGDQLYPRDRTVLIALPGLIKTDQGFNKTLSKAPLADVEALLIGDNGAVTDLETARNTVDKGHPIQLYLIQAQLAAYRNYQVALDLLKNHATVPANDPARTNANAQLKQLNQLLQAQKSGDAGDKLVEYWVELCALDRP